MSKIVVMSGAEDGHLDFVRPYLSSEVVLIDPFCVDETCELSYIFDGRKTAVSYNGQIVTDVKSVWYRKPGGRRFLPTVTEGFRAYAENCLNDHLEMLRAEFQDAHWVSNFYAINKALNKSSQLEIAAKVGFMVPETIMTSDSQKARAFIEKHKSVIVKPQNANIPYSGNKMYFFFAKRISNKHKLNLTNLHLAPSIFQVAIDAVADVRVTVMADTVFAAIVPDTTTKGDNAVRDWRMKHNDSIFFEDYDRKFPKDLREKCRQLVKVMGLEYGAIDFVVDARGNYWFIEINPNGQWAFVEEDTGQQMGKVMAALLER